MPTEQAPPTAAPVIGFLSTNDLAELLIRREGLHEGHFELAVTFNIVVANFKNPESGGPGVLTMLGGVGLSKSAAPTPASVDAAVINPAPQSSSRPARKRATSPA